MKPAEKAIHLVQKFEGLAATPFDGKGNIRLNDIVKQRALICCGEIIEVLEKYDKDNNRKEECRPLEQYVYWTQVKNELSKL